MRFADEGDHVMLAMRVELDVAEHHDIVIASHFVEGAREHLERVLAIAREELVIGRSDAAWRLAQALAVGIIASIGDQRADRLLGLLARRPHDGGSAANLDLRPCLQLLHRGVHE